jgi:Icc-related predicted phosphoesterase
MLGSWGEQMIKSFVKEAVDEALKLDGILGRLETEKKVVIMHYAPIRQTVMGEPAEIFPFLGSTHFEEPLNRRKVNVAFHGHAHKGTFEGKTSQGIPIFNVSETIVKEKFPDKGYFLYEV